jgi:subtilisin family serine protease
MTSTVRSARSFLIILLTLAPAVCYGGETAALSARTYSQDAGLLRRRDEHLALLGAGDWHAHGYRGRGVTVAVLDTGFRGYRDQLGKALPATVTARSFRRDGNLEARDSRHGILCGEVIHALAPEANLLFANWEPATPESFLDAVRWARSQGARVISCSVISPSWSDGEGGGPVHQKLREALGDDALCFASAGNVAQRHWAGAFRAGRDGWHEWRAGFAKNDLRPWGTEPVTIELCWSDPGAAYQMEVLDTERGTVVATSAGRGDRTCSVVRPKIDRGRSYAIRLRREYGDGGSFHLTALGADLAEASARGSIPFPGDGPEVIAVGAVGTDGFRVSYSACGPNSQRPKPDLVAPVPFDSFWQPRPFSGTSAAAPQAAALAALAWSGHPDWTASRVRAALCAAALDLGPAGHDFEYGYGRVRLPGPIENHVTAGATGPARSP